MTDILGMPLSAAMVYLHEKNIHAFSILFDEGRNKRINHGTNRVVGITREECLTIVVARFPNLALSTGR